MAKKDATVIAITVDDTTYKLRHDDVKGSDAMAFRQQMGMSFRKAIELCQEDADIDLIAGLIWLARRQDGDKKITLEEVADGLSYGSNISSSDASDDAVEVPDDTDPNS